MTMPYAELINYVAIQQFKENDDIEIVDINNIEDDFDILLGYK